MNKMFKLFSMLLCLGNLNLFCMAQQQEESGVVDLDNLSGDHGPRPNLSVENALKVYEWRLGKKTVSTTTYRTNSLATRSGLQGGVQDSPSLTVLSANSQDLVKDIENLLPGAVEEAQKGNPVGLLNFMNRFIASAFDEANGATSNINREQKIIAFITTIIQASVGALIIYLVNQTAKVSK